MFQFDIIAHSFLAIRSDPLFLSFVAMEIESLNFYTFISGPYPSACRRCCHIKIESKCERESESAHLKRETIEAEKMRYLFYL